MQCPQESAASLQEHPDFLTLLQDDGFRQELKAHPAEVLGRYGLHLKSEDVPDVVSLPKASDIQSSGKGPIITWHGLICRCA